MMPLTNAEMRRRYTARHPERVAESHRRYDAKRAGTLRRVQQSELSRQRWRTRVAQA